MCVMCDVSGMVMDMSMLASTARLVLACAYHMHGISHHCGIEALCAVAAALELAVSLRVVTFHPPWPRPTLTVMHTSCSGPRRCVETRFR